jgi:hypothetical protein
LREERKLFQKRTFLGQAAGCFLLTELPTRVLLGNSISAILGKLTYYSGLQ